MPRVFDGFEDHDCIHVLDVGDAASSTVEFLAPYRCKVFVMDLADVSAADAAAGAYVDLFNDYEGVLFDVILFWDLLHRLDGDSLAALSDALRPCLYSQTKVHSICHYAPSEAREAYRINGRDQLQVTNAKPMAYRPWSQAAFSREFDCMRIVDDTLTPNGRLELLLQAD